MVGVPGYLGLCKTPTPSASPSPSVRPTATFGVSPTAGPKGPCVFSSSYYINNPNPWSTQAPFNQPVICGYN
eukprot:CAMPEP_0184657314 /NCGR_PEP_ID=MMETSP0308-20130426/18768_1 /TAXON_ID=38269 /ORGANISM="Gloeochaete witrockiana, Strain SAG 46.84" /LENGTH=71 /DNA_ID=CAMNT_0027095021 /DNA_START=10 /DNA_END=222 /DNA_ORIENTATION=+